MIDQDVLTPPSVLGNGAEPPPQDTPPGGQPPAEPQITEPGKVEPGNQQPQNTTTPRKPSDFFRERKEIRELKDTIAKQDRQLSELTAFVQEFKKQNSGVAPSKFDVARFIEQPEVVMKELISREVKTLKDEFDGWKQNQTQSQLDREKQEALGMLFPKASGDPENPYQRAESNPERAEKIQEVFETYPAIRKMIDTNPLEAARLITKLIEDKPQSSPKAIPKSLMGGNSRGNPNIGGNKMERNSRTVLDEVKKMASEEEKNPELRFDKERRAKKQSLITEAEQLAQEKGK